MSGTLVDAATTMKATEITRKSQLLASETSRHTRVNVQLLLVSIWLMTVRTLIDVASSLLLLSSGYSTFALIVRYSDFRNAPGYSGSAQ